MLLKTYWNIPDRQVETFVVLELKREEGSRLLGEPSGLVDCS